MNDGKSIDKTETQPITESSSISEAQSLDLKRRRLIRGAAGLAPVILTLRSGSASAFASGCAPLVQKDATTNTGSTTPIGEITNANGAVKASDKCVIQEKVQMCADQLSVSKKDTLLPADIGGVTLENNKLICSLGNDKTIAIVSATTSVF
jgi:hypothetical protein